MRLPHRRIGPAQYLLDKLGGAHPDGPVNVGAADIMPALMECLPPGGDTQVTGVQQGAVNVEDDAAATLFMHRWPPSR